MRICGWLACIGVALAAMSMYQAYAGETAEGLPAGQRQPAKQPLPAKENPRYYLDLADINMRYEAYEKAAALFEKAIELSADDTVRTGTFHKLGRAYLAIGQTAKAQAALAAPLKTMPEAGRARHLINVGQLYQSEKMLEEAAQAYAQARDTASNDRVRAKARELLVKLYMGTPLGKERVVQLNARLEKDPNNVEILLELMDFYLYQTDITNAEKTADHLYALKPNDVAVLEELGLFYPTVGNIDKTMEIYEALVVKAPDKGSIYYPRIILIYSSQDQLEKALLWADKAAKTGLATGRYYSALGKTYLKAKDEKKALECFKKATEASPDDNRLKIAYAKQLASAGKTKEAREILEPLSENENPRIKNLAKRELFAILKIESDKNK
ncbi:MAG: tetratricopeptide repeat protein [Planctomycetes bacterium]|nr:tetratricopeptide repeat protein [Planctomycetota bacterium]